MNIYILYICIYLQKYIHIYNILILTLKLTICKSGKSWNMEIRQLQKEVPTHGSRARQLLTTHGHGQPSVAAPCEMEYITSQNPHSMIMDHPHIEQINLHL